MTVEFVGVAARPQGRRPGGKYGELEEFVWHKVESLQARYTAGSSEATASLALLRRAVGREPGADPFVWEETLNGFPRRFWGSETDPSPEERAVHAAITLFAVHQQSKSEGMHKRRVNIGRAAALLGKATHSDEAVLRRFHALGTATSIAEAVNHARGLISQFRAESIPLDYGRFAADLARLQDPRYANAVRLDWGRQYYFQPTQPATTRPQTDDEISATSPIGEHT